MYTIIIIDNTTLEEIYEASCTGMQPHLFYIIWRDRIYMIIHHRKRWMNTENAR